MEDRNIIIRNYVSDRVRKLVSDGIYVSSNQIDNLVDRYSSSEDNVEDIMRDIDRLIDTYIENFKRIQELREVIELDDLPIEYTGITLNNQDIDLMNIMGASSIEELQLAIKNASNINLDDLDLSSGDLTTLKEITYRLYQDSLESKNDFIRDPNISLRRKIDYLRKSGELNDEEFKILDDLIRSSSSVDELINGINSSFGKDKVHRMYEIIRECSPIEKSGIKSTNQKATNNLIKEITSKYNSITIDQEAKYGSVYLEDGTFDFRGLDKSLDFAKRMNKQVRLNTLLFYMDCPEELYNLEKNDSNKEIVKSRLSDYVYSITKHISDSGYGNTVRSVDVFNELLNRFAMDGEVPYKYRGDIEQGSEPSDNIKAGWLKHLDIEDLCDVIAIARGNMPNVDFMYNDDNLEDPRKMDETIKLIQRIQEYERGHGIKLIDSIGTQMHIDNSVSIESIEAMFRNLSRLGLPIEVTEFDMAMTHNVDGLSPEQIEELRERKINEILHCINNLAEECNIRGVTIWSKTDSQNFRVSLENEKRIRAGLEPISTLHGGYYTENMESKGKGSYRLSNFHTHTKRCGHAGEFNDEEYIEAAKAVGMSTIGFSDHIPFTDFEYPLPESRMHISEVDDYLESIERLRKNNPDMTILSGYEAEYDPAKSQFLCDMRDRVDYMILGQHFIDDGLTHIQRENNPEYPIEYARSVCEAIDSGLFDIVAHPDIFMKHLSSIEKEEKREEFLRNSGIASRMICEKAKEMGIPVELNLSGIAKGEGYPNPLFWQIASEVGVQVVSGADAHNPNQLINMALDQQKAQDLIGNVPLNYVTRDYNPLKAREMNQRLQASLNRTRNNSVSYESYLITQAVGGFMRANHDTDIETVCLEVANKFRQKAQDETPSRKIDKIVNDSSISPEEKKQKLDKLKKQISSPHYQDTLSKRQSVLESGASILEEASSHSFQSKGELLSHVKNSMESRTQNNTTNNDSKRSDIGQMLSSPTPQKQPTKQQSQPKVLRITPPSNNITGGNSGKKGFVESIYLSTMLGLAFGIMIVSILLIIILS